MEVRRHLVLTLTLPVVAACGQSVTVAAQCFFGQSQTSEDADQPQVKRPTLLFGGRMTHECGASILQVIKDH